MSGTSWLITGLMIIVHSSYNCNRRLPITIKTGTWENPKITGNHRKYQKITENFRKSPEISGNPRKTGGECEPGRAKTMGKHWNNCLFCDFRAQGRDPTQINEIQWNSRKIHEIAPDSREITKISGDLQKSPEISGNGRKLPAKVKRPAPKPWK